MRDALPALLLPAVSAALLLAGCPADRGTDDYEPKPLLTQPWPGAGTDDTELPVLERRPGQPSGAQFAVASVAGGPVRGDVTVTDPAQGPTIVDLDLRGLEPGGYVVAIADATACEGEPIARSTELGRLAAESDGTARSTLRTEGFELGTAGGSHALVVRRIDGQQLLACGVLESPMRTAESE